MDRSFLFVPNLSKTNIVAVNDKKPTGAVKLEAMDVITMGRTSLRSCRSAAKSSTGRSWRNSRSSAGVEFEYASRASQGARSYQEDAAAVRAGAGGQSPRPAPKVALPS